MTLKKLAVFAAFIAVATPSLAFDTKDQGASTMFYVSIPLDSGLSKKQQHWNAGLQLHGKHEYQAVNIDSQMLGFAPLGGIEAKWVIAGVVAVGAAAAIAHKDKGSSSHMQEQQATQVQAACPPHTSSPCPH
jgi:hypothetical protein